MTGKDHAIAWLSMNVNTEDLPAYDDSVFDRLAREFLSERVVGLRIGLAEAESKIRPNRITNADIIAESIRQRIANINDGVEQ